MFCIALEYPQLSASPCAAAPQVRKVIPTNHPALTQPRMNTPPENSASAYHNHFPNHTVIGSWHLLLRLRTRGSEMQRRILSLRKGVRKLRKLSNWFSLRCSSSELRYTGLISYRSCF